MGDVTVRFFAAAEDAAGACETSAPLPNSSTLAELLRELGRSRPELAHVLRNCSYLRNSVAVLDHQQPLEPGDVIDVLPPFSGG